MWIWYAWILVLAVDMDFVKVIKIVKVCDVDARR